MQINVTIAEPRRFSLDLRRSAPALILMGVAFLILAATSTILFFMIYGGAERKPPHLAPPQAGRAPIDPVKITATDPAQLKQVSAADAEVLNGAIPISTLPNPAAVALKVPTSNPLSLSRSLECLTTAIYYEAANEPDDGQRAVAQVILNRVRHPSFPHTVCGVVYQGSEKSTGCQFSFTCDGSLARKPAPQLWARARSVAAAALAGSVYAPVGWTTHYHADYVLPYWASSLTKLAQIGRHIFYRLPGWSGSAAAFSAHYSGLEPSIPVWNGANGLAASGVTGTIGTPGGYVAVADRPILMRSGDATAPNGAVLKETARGSAAPAPTRWVLAPSGSAADALLANHAVPASGAGKQ